MDILDEAKEFVRLHAIAQDMDQAEFASVLAEINSIGRDGDRDWTRRFATQAESARNRGDMETAFEYLNLARFPYAATPLMEKVHHDAVAVFDQLIAGRPLKTQRRMCSYQGLNIPYYLYNCGRAAPVLFICGGIVSTKEQWRDFLSAGRKLGVSVLLAEMPGVGENPLRYDAESPAFISALLDDAEKEIRFSRAHLIAFSFSGNLALQQASVDDRIAAVTTVGAPLHAFFTDRDWWPRVPKITQKTLAHICRVSLEHLPEVLPTLALPEDTLQSLDIPLYYVSARHDEIIPPAEVQQLYRNMPSAQIVAFADVHGAPNNFDRLKKFIVSSILAQTSHNGLLRLVGRFQQRVLKARFGYCGEA